MSVPGSHDETVRVLWINEYREVGRNLIGSWARSVKEYDKAARAQKKSNAMMIQSAEEAALASMAQQKAERDRLVEFRKLSLQEYNLRRSHNAKMSALRKAQEKEMLLDTRANEIVAVEEAKRQKSAKEIATAKQREMRDKRADARNDIADIKKLGQAEMAALKEQRAALARESKKTSTTTDRKKEITEERKALQERINKRQDVMTDDVAAREKTRNKEIEELKNEMNERIAVIRASGKGEREALRQELEKTTKLHGVSLAQQRERVKGLETEVSVTEDKLKRLEALRTELGSVEKTLRKGGVGANDDTISRVAKRAQHELHQQEIEVSKAQFQIKQYSETLRNEMSSAGQVSAQTFEKLRGAVSRANVSQKDFNELTHAGGIHIKNFATEKTREIVALKKNTDQLGQHNTQMKQAISHFKSLITNLRITGNGFRLLRVAIAGLLLPTLATAVSILVQAITTLVGGATALTAALAPLVGQVAGLAPLAFGAAQAFGVWSLAMTHLGTSSATVGKLISTSLTGSAQAFQTMLKQLPKQAQGFAIQIRQNLFPAIDKLRTELQKKLFPAISDAIKFAAPGFRGMNKILVGTASAIGNVIRQIGGRIGSPAWARDLQTIGKNTNRWIRELTPALLHLVDAFRNLAVAAAPVVDHFVHLTNVFARWIAIQTGYGRVSGNLTRFFKESNQVLDTTLSLFGNLGKAFLNVGRIAGNVLGNQMLRDLRGQTVALNEWTSRGKNVQKMTQYFTELKKPLYEVGRLARDLFKAFFQVTNNQEFFKVVNQLRTEALPALVGLLKNVNKSFAPAIIDLLTSVLKTLSALGEQGAFTMFVNILRQIVDLLGFIARSPVLGFFLKLVAVLGGLRFALNTVALLTRNFVGLGRALGLSVFQAGALNRELASRGLIGFRAPPSVSASDAAMAQGAVTPVQFGRRTVNVPTQTVEELQRGTLMHPSSAVAGGFIQQPMTRELAEREAAIRQTEQQRRFGLLSRNSGLVGGAVGAGLLGVGAMTGGRAGSILSGAGLGAAVGSAFTPLGTAVGAAVGGLGGFVLSLTHATSAVDRLSEAAQKAAEQTGGARQRVQEAAQDFRPAALAREEARRNLVEQKAQLQKLRRTPGMQGQVEQQKLAVGDAAEVFRRAVGRLAHDKEIIRTFEPVIASGKKTFGKIFADERMNVQKQVDRLTKALASTPANQKSEIAFFKTRLKGQFDGYIKFLQNLQATSKDQKVVTIAKNLERIAESAHRLNTNKEIKVQLKLFGPTAFLEKLVKLSQIGIPIRVGDVPRDRRAGGGRIPGSYVAADTVPALLSPGEFVVTGSGEQMLEQMTGMPGVLDYVGAMQRPHFAVGGRVRQFRGGGAVTPYNTQGIADEAIRSALGGGTYGDMVAQAIDSATSAMAGIDTSTQSASGISKNAPKGLREKMTQMISEAGGLLSEHLLSAPGVVPKHGPIQKDMWRKSRINHKTGVDPGAAISDILQAGAGKFSLQAVNSLFMSNLLEKGKSKYVTVYLAPGALSEPGYGASIMIGAKGFGFSGDKFGRRDQTPTATQMHPFHVKGWPMREGGRVRFRTGGSLDDLGMWEYDQHHKRRRRPRSSIRDLLAATHLQSSRNEAAQLRALRNEQAQAGASERARRMAFRFAKPRETTVQDFKDGLEFATGYRELLHPGRDPLGAALAGLSIIPGGRFARLGHLGEVSRSARSVKLFRGEGARTAESIGPAFDTPENLRGQWFTTDKSWAKAITKRHPFRERRILKTRVPRDVADRAAKAFEDHPFSLGLDEGAILPKEFAAKARETIPSRVRRSDFLGPLLDRIGLHMEILRQVKGDIRTSRYHHYHPRGLYYGKRPEFMGGYKREQSLGDLGRYQNYKAPFLSRVAARTMVGAARAESFPRSHFGLYPPWGALGIGSKAYRADRSRAVAEAGPINFMQELKESFHGPDSIVAGNKYSLGGLLGATGYKAESQAIKKILAFMKARETRDLRVESMIGRPSGNLATFRARRALVQSHAKRMGVNIGRVPRGDEQAGSFDHLTNTIYPQTPGWMASPGETSIMFHELGHALRGHSRVPNMGKFQKIRQEFQASKWAFAHNPERFKPDAIRGLTHGFWSYLRPDPLLGHSVPKRWQDRYYRYDDNELYPGAKWWQGQYTQRRVGGRIARFRGGGRVARFQTGGFADRHNLVTQTAQRNSTQQGRQMDADRHNLVVLAGKARMAAEAALLAANKASDTADRALTNSKGGGGGSNGNGGGAGPQFANAPTEFGLAAQARERLALTSFANNVKDNSISSLSGLAKNIKAELKRMGDALSSAQLAGKAKLADKIQAQMTVVQSRLQIVMDAVGDIINKLARQIQKSADRITAIQDRLQNRLLISGVDPAGMTALKMTQKAQAQIVKQDQMQLKMVKRQLADLRAVGAPQDVLDQYVQAVAAARQALNDALAEAIVGRRAILRRKFERRETRAGFREQMAELKLANIQTQAQIAGAFDGGAGQSAAFINSSIIPAIRKEIAAVEATLAHAKKLKLTEDEKNAKLIQLQELQNQLSQMQLEAQQDANAMLAKTLGKLSFEFQGQSFSDMIGSGTGI